VDFVRTFAQVSAADVALAGGKGAHAYAAFVAAAGLDVPAVLGTGAVTDRLHTGERVRVDGDAGTVRVLGDEA